MSMFDSRHNTQRNADEVVMSNQVISSHNITSHQISIYADAHAAAADIQPLTSLTYQPEIPQDIT